MTKHQTKYGWIKTLVIFAGGLCIASLLTKQGQTMKLNVESIQTTSGVEAWLVHDDTVPIVAIDIAFLGGGTQDPEGLEGRAAITASLMTEGSGSLNAQNFKRELEALGSSIDCSATYDYLFCSAQMLASNKDQVFKLLRNVLTAPRFDVDVIQRIKMQYESVVNAHKEDPSWLASQAFYRAALPHHPYARALDGTPDSIARLTQKDFQLYFSNIVAQKNASITLVGPITKEEAKERLETLLASIPREPHLVATPKAAMTLGNTKKVNIPNPQTVAVFGIPGPNYLSPDFIPATVLNYILGGGGFSSRLMDEIREKRGLAYYAYTRLVQRLEFSAFVGSFGTQTQKVDQSLKIAQEQIAKLANQGVTKQELTSAKSYLTGSYPLGFDSNSAIASHLLGVRLSGLGFSYINNRNTLIDAVDIKTLNRVAARYLNAKLTLGLAGEF